MHGEHWLVLGLTAGIMGLLACASVLGQPGSRGYRWLRRALWAFLLLFLSGALGGVGVNGFTLPVAMALGAPGYAALTLLRFF